MPLSPSQRRDIVLLAILRGGSFLGDSVALVALYLRAAHHGHAWAVVGLALSAALPLMAISPFAGHIVDKVSAKRLIAGVTLLQVLACAGMGLWHGLGLTLLLVALLNVGVAFTFPASQALLAHIATNDNITSAQSIAQVTQGTAGLAGSAIGGVLVGLFGQSVPFYLDAVTFAVLGLGVLLVRADRLPEPDVRDKNEESGMARYTLGAKLLFSDALLRPIFIMAFFFILLIGAVNVTEVFFATRTLHATPTMYGLLTTFFGVGSILGALVAAKLRTTTLAQVIYTLAGLAWIGIAIGVAGLCLSVWQCFAPLAIGGVGQGIIEVASGAIMVKRIAPEVRGRAFSAINAFMTSGQILAMVLGGVLLTTVSPRTVFQLGGVASLLVVVVFATSTIRAAKSVG
jgi:MFS family permease